MESKTGDTTVSMIGYAVGMGIVGIALIGIPLQFAYPETSAILTYGGAFAIGALAGAAVAAVRGTRL